MTMPAVIHYLQDTNVWIAMKAVQAVGTLGPDAKAAVPLLIKLLRRPESRNKQFIEKTLKQVDPKTASELGFQ